MLPFSLIFSCFLSYYIEATNDLKEAQKILKESQYPDEKNQNKIRKLSAMVAQVYKLKGDYHIAAENYKKGAFLFF